jgi:DNA-binding beta-propeller fold protein YncE
MRWLAASALLVLAGAAGCGSQYRPVINPVVPTGPAAQPTSYTVVFSQPGLVPPADPSLSPTTPPCPGLANGVFQSYANPGVATIVSFAGDSIMALAQIGNGPLSFAVDPTGSLAYSENCDGTISSVPISTSLQTNKVGSSTLLAGAVPINMLVATGSQFVVEEGRDAIAALSGTPPALKQEIFVAPSVINVAGSQTGQRVYSISQGNISTAPNFAWGTCANPSSVTTAGEADAIEVATNTISARLPLGICPVFAITSADGLRTFVMNRGSGTITVINSQLNTLDTKLNPSGTINLCGGSTPCNAGPVYAELYTPGNRLVTANYDNNTISVIDVSLDVYGNDSATFGKVLATVPVGTNPAMVTVLQDGSRAYTANQGNGTVTVVNLTSFTPQQTISLGSGLPNPRTIVSSYNYPTGKVYVSSQSSPNLVIIRTDTDTVSATVAMQGNVVDVRTTTQYAGSTTQGGNNITFSRSAGSGVP